jgi:hypothetical protein
MVVGHGKVTFHDSYNGTANCFVAEHNNGSTAWNLCGGKDIYITWYYGRELSDEVLPTGNWAMKFFNDGVEFYSGEFTLLPEINPEKITLLNQGAHKEHYDSACRTTTCTSIKCDYVCDGRDDEVEVTISQEGCYLTGAASILNYHGVLATPPALNDWLKLNDGYIGAGRVDPIALTKYARANGVNMTFLGSSYGLDELENLIYTYGPQLAWAKSRGHFITVTGMDPEKTTYKIMDPSGGVMTTLAARNYVVPDGGVRIFAGPEFQYTDMSGIIIYFHSPGELVIEDPNGLKTGYDPIEGVYYNEIPRSSYSATGLNDDVDPVPVTDIPMVEELEVMRPSAGDYKLYVMGTGEGTYDLDIAAYDPDGVRSLKQFKDVEVAPGDVHTFSFYYPKASGAGINMGFDGGGQRPKDVNTFLSYIRPSQRQTSLPAGTTSYNMLIAYGESIVPSTFKAVLNGENITNEFSPKPSGAESILLNLVPGRNTLVLSIDAEVNGRISTDKDRLIFVTD